jgi:hypothetical protein
MRRKSEQIILTAVRGARLTMECASNRRIAPVVAASARVKSSLKLLAE